MLLSVAAMIFWEFKGRDALVLSKVLVASQPISAGSSVSSSDFRPISVTEESLIAGAFSPADANLLNGLIAVSDIARNMQVSSDMFRPPSELLPREGESFFPIPREWIASGSSAIRAGDRIGIYALPDGENLGNYPVIFCKDERGLEIRDVRSEGDRRGDKVFERDNPSGILSHVEISCRLQDYMVIRDCVMSFGEASLLLVLEEGAADCALPAGWTERYRSGVEEMSAEENT